MLITDTQIRALRTELRALIRKIGASDELARDEAYRGVLRALNDAVDAAGLGIAAGACGCRTQDLSDALTARANRYIRVEWLLAICDVSAPDFRARIVSALVSWQGLRVAPANPLTPEQKLARLQALLVARFGQAGAELAEEMDR